MPVGTRHVDGRDPDDGHRGLGRGPHHAGHHAGERTDLADRRGPRPQGGGGRPAALRVEPRPGQRDLQLPQGDEPAGPGQAHARPRHATCWPTTRSRRRTSRAAQADYNDASTDVQNDLQALRIFGITAQEIDEAERQNVPISSEMAVRSPIGGIVVQKLVLPGQLIQAGATTCFFVSDTSTVWVQGHLLRPGPRRAFASATRWTSPRARRCRAASAARSPTSGRCSIPATRTTPVRIVTQQPGRAAEEGHVRRRGDPHLRAPRTC